MILIVITDIILNILYDLRLSIYSEINYSQGLE